MFSYQSHDLDGNSAISDSFTKVPRAGLQALSKKFNIRGNMKNVEMVHALSLLAQTDEQVLVALQELLVSLSLTQRAKKKQLNLDEQQCRAKRIDLDEDIMSKAQRLAAKRNLETSEFSFITYNPKTIIPNMKNIGINLGKNEKKVLNSVVAIKNIEIDRLAVTAKSSYPFNIRTDEEESEEFDADLSHITQSWDDDVVSNGIDLCYDLNDVPCRKKVNRARSIWKFTRHPKKLITPSNISL
jgi:hypothetical protein